ncbi:MAG: hypothetical protein J1E78_03055 [Muribaculaceae bacterium]|nr:hypothetical protein [Muribaculaceae bacterium]
MKKVLLIGFLLSLSPFYVLSKQNLNVSPTASDLTFTFIPQSWDEGIPLGNAVIGALVWEKEGNLRMSLDRTDLWDLRQSDSLSGENFKYEWVKQHIRNGNYDPVHAKLDDPYDMIPAPSKIPGAAIEFPLEKLGETDSVRLYLNDALAEIKWKGGATLKTFVNANEPIGWFKFTNVPEGFKPVLITPQYNNGEELGVDSPVSGQDLRRLRYPQGEVSQTENEITYIQPGYDGYFYKVVVKWERTGKDVTGVWSITSSLSEDDATELVERGLDRGIVNDYSSHKDFWNRFWAKSTVTLPDSILQKQYDNEIYKFGSTTREHSYPISLQAVWTADNGHLPPWKGDYHHDLNTQLSYWPAYTGNYLEEGFGYLNTLLEQRDVFRKYTQDYFECDGLAIPGVTTLTGEPMGGWIQYSLSPTVGAWLAQHFYQHWKYSADQEFLLDKGYPFVKEIAIFLENITQLDNNGLRTLEFSSSPEIFDNSINAWFPTITNYDLSLLKFLFCAASEMAIAAGNKEEGDHWLKIKNQLPDFNLAEDNSLTFAEGFPYEESHRHFSHAMAIHPLGLIDWNDSEQARNIIKATVKRLEEIGPDYWTGYSYSWLGNIYARAMDGDKAADALKIFAECFCLPNTFHANGDQSKSGKSRFTYRPFTLEGNFAFAAGIQEMLLQSHKGVIRIFPAIPSGWENVSFDNLRATGAFLVSAERIDGDTVGFSITSEKGGEAKFINPVTGELSSIELKPGETYSWHK